MGIDLESTKGKAVLFSEMTPPAGRENDFNDWYDGHHTPSHVKGVPGFISAMRYKSSKGPHYLAVYELSGPEALDHDEYKKRKLTPDDPTYKMLKSVSGFTRYIAVEKFFKAKREPLVKVMDASIVFCAFASIPIEAHREFENRFDNEQVLMLLDCPGWLMSRRFQIIEYDPERYTHLSIHYLADESVLNSGLFKKARDTDREGKLSEENWFQPHLVTYQRRNTRFLK